MSPVKDVELRYLVLAAIILSLSAMFIAIDAVGKTPDLPKLAGKVVWTKLVTDTNFLNKSLRKTSVCVTARNPLCAGKGDVGLFRKLGLSMAVGVAVFASLAPIIWSSLDGNTFIASAMGGGLIGCAGYSFGTCTFWLAKQLGHGSLFATVVGLFFRVASAIAAFLLGGLLTFLYIVHIWGPFVYRPGRHFPGDTSILLQSCVGAILTLVLSLLYAFCIVQAWLEMRDRSES